MSRTDRAELADTSRLSRVAWCPVGLAMAALAVVLSLTSNRYGYHRDELYFRMLHPAWGYVDQPPLAPLLARAFSAGLADSPWAMRIPATSAAVVSVLVLALVTRELGGGRRAQAMCAWGYAFASIPLIMGHALLTSTLDLPVWPAFVLFVIRAQLRGQPRWWLAAGAVAGLSTSNKLLIAVLVVAVAAGILVSGPRALLRSRWPAAGALLALVLSVPNIVYQAGHGWPQLSIGRALARENASSVHVMLIPFLFLILGPPLAPVWLSGWIALLRRDGWRPVRLLGAAFPVLLVLVFAMGAQFYYPFGLLAVLFAAGCVPLDRWMGTSAAARRLAVGGVALNSAVSVVLGLPVIPVSRLGATPIPSINQVERDTVGWPAYVREIEAVYDTVPRAEQRTAIVLTSNYGEAGAVARYGRPGLRGKVYSGHNQLFYDRKPPASAAVVVFVGGQVLRKRGLFETCRIAGSLDDQVGVDNEEQGKPIAVCRMAPGGWTAGWPALRHEG